MKLTRDKIQRMVGSQGLVGSGAAGGGGTIGVTEQRVMEILQDYETIDALETTLENYVTTTALETTLANYATKTYVDQNYLSLSFFNALFQARTSQGAVVAPNSGDTTTIDNIKAMFGFWTDQYISALGQGSDGSAITSLAALTDVQLSMPLADGEVLTYSTTLGKWTNGAGVSTAWANITGKPTTIAGYGITDAHITNGVITLGANTITPITSLTGYATQTWVQQQGYATTSSLNDYLPLSGGEMTGNITMAANSIVFTQSTTPNWNVGSGTGIKLLNTVAASATGAVGNYHVGLSVSGYYTFQLAAYGGGDSINIYWRNENNTWREIIHSGNIGSQSVSYASSAGDASTLEGTAKSGLFTALSSDATTKLSITIGGTTNTLSTLYASHAAQLTTSRSLWGNSFNGTGDINGNIVMAATDGTYIQIGGARIVWDNTNKALKVIQSDNSTAANFYATGAISALGQGVDGGGGGQGDVTWTLLADGTDTRQIALSHLTTALSGYALTSQIPTNNNQLTNGAGYITGITSSMVTSALGYTPANSSSLSSYLPLSGGTMTGNITMGANAIVFNQNTSSTWNVSSGSGIKLLNTVGTSATGAPGSYHIGLSVSGFYGFQLAAFGGGGSLLFRNGVGGGDSSWVTIIDSSTIGSQSVSYASSAGSVAWANVSDRPTNVSSFTNDSGYITSSALSSYLPLSGGTMTGNITMGANAIVFNQNTSSTWNVSSGSGIKLLNTVGASSTGAAGDYNVGLSVSGYYTFQLSAFGGGDSTNIYWRNGNNTWREIIHSGNIGSQSVNYATSSGSCSGNAASATKLQTSRTIWGQSFDGTGNVSGSLSSVANISFDQSGRNIGSIAYFDTTNSRVGIGTSTPAAKLDIDGSAKIGSGAKFNTICIEVNNSIAASSSRTGEINCYASGLYLQQDTTNSLYVCAGGGNVGIGTTSASYKLHVAGDVYATGGVTSLSDIRKKDVLSYDLPLTIEQVAEAPTIKFLWKDKREMGEQVGTVAQYWQKVLPEVTKDRSNELSMSYGVTALIAAITTARTVVDHEKRITELERECADWREAYNALRMDYEQLKLKIA